MQNWTPKYLELDHVKDCRKQGCLFPPRNHVIVFKTSTVGEILPPSKLVGLYTDSAGTRLTFS